MARPIPAVPDLDPGQQPHEIPLVVNPLLTGVFWNQRNITNIPQHAVGWLVANGWRITRTVSDGTTVPPTISYDMTTEQLKPDGPDGVVVTLLNDYTREANHARQANNFRYRDVINNWTEMIASTQAHADAEVEEQNACLGVYLADLDALDEIDDLLEANRLSLDQSFGQLETDTNARLDGLGTTDLARINEEFAASLSTQTQQLTDKGWYSSPITTDITARNTRDKDEQIQLLNDRLNRERLQNDHQLYGAETGLANFKQQAILARMNVKVTQLEGLKRVHEDNMRLMAYQLDVRNKLLVGLYGFVERREDPGPQWEQMSTMIAALGEAGGGSWIQP